MFAAVRGRWVASAHSTSYIVGANYVGTSKCAYLRAFSRRCLIENRKKFDFRPCSPSRATQVILTN